MLEEVLILDSGTKRGLVALFMIMIATLAAGCMPRGAASSPGWTVVAADDKIVYAALATGKVVALDATNGQEAWSYPLPTQQKSSGGILGGLLGGGSSDTGAKPLGAVYGVPALTGKLVVVASYDHHLYAFDRESGQEVWTFAAEGALVGDMTVDGGIAYFGSSDHSIYAIDVASGKSVWEHPFATRNLVWGAPAVDDKRVYVGSMDHHVYALNRQTGAEEWQQDLGSAIPGTIALDDGVLYVGGVDKQLHALKAADGSRLWARALGHWVWGEALVRDGYVYVGSLDGKVHAVRVSDGSPRWDAVTVEGAVRAGPVALDGQLLVGTDVGKLYRINMETGSSEVLFSATGSLLSKPAVVGQRIYIGTTTDIVYALDTGRQGEPQVWVYPPRTK